MKMKDKTIGPIRLVFLVVAIGLIVFQPEQILLAVAILFGMVAADLLFGWLKAKWKRGTHDFEKIMEEEIGR